MERLVRRSSKSEGGSEIRATCRGLGIG